MGNIYIYIYKGNGEFKKRDEGAERWRWGKRQENVKVRSADGASALRGARHVESKELVFTPLSSRRRTNISHPPYLCPPCQKDNDRRVLHDLIMTCPPLHYSTFKFVSIYTQLPPHLDRRPIPRHAPVFHSNYVDNQLMTRSIGGRHKSILQYMDCIKFSYSEKEKGKWSRKE